MRNIPKKPPAGMCGCHFWAWSPEMMEVGWVRIQDSQRQYVDHHPRHALELVASGLGIDLGGAR